ncbi:MAG: hypothetical protein HY329_28180, partial [Chloroflexi bacterium]|nr:hypothetical protein [Chloroflexota bacterium]
ALVLLVAISGPGAAWYLVLAVIVSMVPPLLWLGRGIYLGRISDLDVSRHEERFGLYIVGATACLLAVILMLALGAPPDLTATFASAVCAMLVAVPVHWVMKPSVHVGVLTLAVINLAPRLPMTAIAFGLATALVAWARWHLERHTAREVVAGAALGLAGVLMVRSLGVG